MVGVDHTTARPKVTFHNHSLSDALPQDTRYAENFFVVLQIVRWCHIKRKGNEGRLAISLSSRWIEES